MGKGTGIFSDLKIPWVHFFVYDLDSIVHCLVYVGCVRLNMIACLSYDNQEVQLQLSVPHAVLERTLFLGSRLVAAVNLGHMHLNQGPRPQQHAALFCRFSNSLPHFYFQRSTKTYVAGCQ